MNKYLMAMISVSVFGCSVFSNQNNNTNEPNKSTPVSIIKTTPQPPKINAISSEESEVLDIPYANTKHQTAPTIQPRIEELRSPGGNVEVIKVNNKDLPDYYIYPSAEEDLNINNQPNKNVATPSWQIDW